jgi:ABC-type Mn2+/Zn2+ transport system permease subunit
LQAGTAALAAVEGVAGLWLAYALNIGPGPAIAVLGGAVFAVVAVVRR